MDASNLTDRLQALVQLGKQILKGDEYLDAVVQRTAYTNPWFTIENQQQALSAIAEDMLASDSLAQWIGQYAHDFDPQPSRTIGLVLAGNIPLVGFHDWLSVFVSGHRAQVKLSDKDPYLLPALVRLLDKIDDRFSGQTSFVERLSGFDAVIATGSNNSARYFEAYFGKYPHIIRRNRNAVAVLDGKEAESDWQGLQEDVFQYFGLGCRNVSKLYVPAGYDFHPLLEHLYASSKIIRNEKYKHNFDYQLALDILNNSTHLHNGRLILRENPAMASPVATLHYQFFGEMEQLEQELVERKDEIQCVVARPGLLKYPSFPFGKAQRPALWDYADGEDTLAFLKELP
jgi:hypothetical protein